MSVRFTMTDTGIGIRENFLDQIFEPSEQETMDVPLTIDESVRILPRLNPHLEKMRARSRSIRK